jgi:predicted AAA+ superfamily ATPase
LLAGQSPWRTRPARWEDEDADMRAARLTPLDYQPAPLADVRPPGLYVLRGPRRVGKTLEIKRAVARLIAAGTDPALIFYCSCDELSQQDLRRLIVSTHSMTRTLDGPRYWLLDEITAVPGWERTIKSLRDQDATFREACVVLSGSSAYDLRAATKALADRRGGVNDSDRLLLPMSFRAFCRALGGSDDIPATAVLPRDFLRPQTADAIYDLEPWMAWLDDAWQLFLEVGGFPRAVASFIHDGAVEPGFVAGIWDVLKGDALRSTSMSEAGVAVLLDRLVQNLGSPINARAVATDVGLRDGDRVNDRIAALTSSFFAWRCYRLRGELPNTAAQRKLYFVDPLFAQLAHRHNPHFTEPDVTQLSEQQLGLTLVRAATRSDPAAFLDSDRVMYERAKSGAEIDFVGPDLGVPFESKYTNASWRREARTIRARYGSGVIATRTPFAVGGDEEVWAVPVGIVAWLLAS